MSKNIEWLEVLSKCKENVNNKITPHLSKMTEPQPDLGVGAGGDPMKTVDLAAEKAIIESLLDENISFTLISEESGIRQFGKSPKNCYVTVDPIDGTTNLTRGLPFYCSSIAVSHKPLLSEVYAGMVTDLFHGTTYTALKGRGAFKNSNKIKTASTTSFDEAIIGLDLNTYKIREIAPVLTNFIAVTRHIRHFGANALEICYVAEGLTDAFMDIRGRIRTTDVAAGFLILSEAGGKITDAEGKPLETKLDPKEQIKFVASGNSILHNKIINLIEA